ncbi:hypothetical protein, partial [Burkholderia sola]
ESRLLHSVELPQRENSTSDPAGSAGGLPRDARQILRLDSFTRLRFILPGHIEYLSFHRRNVAKL